MELGGSELILILVAIVLLFGGKKLPELMRGMGKGVREFKNAKDGKSDEAKEEPKAPAGPAALLNEAPEKEEEYEALSASESSRKAAEKN